MTAKKGDLDSFASAVYDSFADMDAGRRNGCSASDHLQQLRRFRRAILDYESQLNGQARGDITLDFTFADAIHEKPISWLWYPWLPAGKIVMLSGDPGCGKSQLALWIAARLTTDLAFPGDARLDSRDRPKGPVIYLTNEDGLEDTLKPRIIAAGADPKQIIVVKGLSVQDDPDGKPKSHDFTLADASYLQTLMRDSGAKAAFIDPVQAYLPHGTNSNSATEVRAALKALVPISEETGCTVFCIRHRGKKRESGGKLSGLGSIDFTAICRSELVVASHPDHEGAFVAFHTKSSCAKPAKPFWYTIENHNYVRQLDNLTIETSNILHQGNADLDAEDTLTEKEASSAKSDAEAFIHTMLADGPIPVSTLESEAKKALVSIRTLDRARRSLHVKAKRLTTDLGAAGPWLAYLPGQLDS